MNDDGEILLFSFIVYWVILILLTLRNKNKIKTGLINLFIHITYCSYFLLGLLYRSESGTALAWFLYLLFFIWTHSLINIGQLIYCVIKTRNK
jgi:hypothetical protein